MNEERKRTKEKNYMPAIKKNVYKEATTTTDTAHTPHARIITDGERENSYARATVL